MYALNFEDLYEYDAGASGITLPVELGFGGRRVRVLTKLDTGSTYCVFQRERGEELGLNIESGAQEEISTPMGSFTAYGHEVTLSALGFQLDVVAYFASRASAKCVRPFWLDATAPGRRRRLRRQTLPRQI
jgi:hypothetical protein